jgi:hypothetical protein
MTPQALTAARANVEQTTYNHARPNVNIFTPINEYASMVDAAHAEEATPLLINIGLIFITCSTIYSSNIRKWHDTPTTDQTWPNFKTHFKDAQKAIKRSQPAITTNSLGFYEQANTASLDNQVIDRLASQQDNELTTSKLNNSRNTRCNSTSATQLNKIRVCSHRCKHSQPPCPPFKPKSMMAQIANKTVEEEAVEDVDLAAAAMTAEAEVETDLATAPDYCPNIVGCTETVHIPAWNVNRNRPATLTMLTTAATCRVAAPTIVFGCCDVVGQ